MFREMRRKRQKISLEECEDILCRGTSGVLAVSGDGGYPYTVPLSYLYENGKIFFHCAKTGHKIDAVRRNERVSFCVIDRDQIVPEEYTVYFRSVIVFGRIRELKEENEKRAAIEKLAVKYSPRESALSRERAIEKEYGSVCVLELSAEYISGKEAVELTVQKTARGEDGNGE